MLPLYAVPYPEPNFYSCREHFALLNAGASLDFILHITTFLTLPRDVTGTSESNIISLLFRRSLERTRSWCAKSRSPGTRNRKLLSCARIFFFEYTCSCRSTYLSVTIAHHGPPSRPSFEITSIKKEIVLSFKHNLFIRTRRTKFKRIEGERLHVAFKKHCSFSLVSETQNLQSRVFNLFWLKGGVPVRQLPKTWIFK